MVGRDLLAGFAGGAVVLLVIHLFAIGPGAADDPFGLRLPASSLSSIRHVAYFLVWNLGEALARCAGLMAVLVLLRGLLRNQAAAIAVTLVFVVMLNLNMSIGALPFRVSMLLVTVALALFLVFRFGLLAICSSSWIILTVERVPLTFDAGSWYFGRSMLTLCVIGAVVLFTFVRSLDGKSILPGPLLEE
jgi:hypothetical protein